MGVGAKSSRAPSRQHETSETQDPGLPAGYDHEADTEVHIRAGIASRSSPVSCRDPVCRTSFSTAPVV